jgi:hypothetical protein
VSRGLELRPGTKRKLTLQVTLGVTVKRLWLPVGILLAVSGQAAVNAIDVQLTLQDIQRATELARFPNRDADRAQFHKRYTFAVNSPVVGYFAVETIEVITPFRRMELIAEEHARINDLFARGGLQDAEEALKPWRDRVSVVAHLRFDSTKVIPGVPEAEVTLEGPDLVFPLAIKGSGVYTRTGDQTWLTGGIVEAAFDVLEVGQTMRPVVLRWNGKEVARVAVNFAAME